MEKDVDIKVRLLDLDKELTVPKGTSIFNILYDLGLEEEKKYVAAFLNDKLVELSWKMYKDSDVRLLEVSSPIGFDLYKRSITLLMLKAARDVLNKKEGEYRIEIMYSLGNGFFCRLEDGSTVIDEEVLGKIKNRMREIVDSDLKIEKKIKSTAEVQAKFKERDLPGKAALLRYRRASRINIYTLGGYDDYYYGYMVPSTGYLKEFDLVSYDDGFVLVIPDRNTMKIPGKYVAPKKLYTILRKSEDWGRRLQINNVGELNNRIVAGEVNDIIMLQEAMMEKQIADIAESIVDEKKKIILIAGPSSSGKTTFSNRLSVQLRAHGMRPHPIAMDNFFKEREETPRDENGKYDFECIEAMDLDLFNSTMMKLLDGEVCDMPEFDFTVGKKMFGNSSLQMMSDDVLVVEGIHALNPQSTVALPQEANYKIYISALTQLNIDEHNRISTTDTRLLRRIIRDARTRGNTATKTISMWGSVRRGETENIFPFQEEADAMFNSALIYELSALKLFAEPLLFSVSEDSDEYYEAKRLLKFLDYFLGIDVQSVPQNSLIREFIGGGCFKI